MKSSQIFKGDKVIWVIFFFLCIISLVEVFSAASTLSYKTGSFWSPFIKQASFLALGTLVVVGVHNIPCRFFKVIPIFFLPVCCILLLVTSFFGGSTNDAARWIEFGVFRFQPSELAKGAVITSVALILARMQRKDGADPRAFKYIMWITGIFFLLIFTENLSTAALLFGVVFLMMFIGRVPLILLGKLLGILFAMLLFVVLIIKVVPKDSAVFELPGLHRLSTWKARLEKHSNDKELSAAEFDVENNAQVAHANIAIASSKIRGKGPGNSIQRDFLSQAFSDFIFAIVIEELGIFGAIGVVLLYVWLLFRAGRIASRCERNFPAFLVMGLALLLVSQAVLNMMVATGLFPVTGQPLPLISRGGTSTLVTCAYIGMMLSVSRYARSAKEHSDPFVAEGESIKGVVRQDEKVAEAEIVEEEPVAEEKEVAQEVSFEV